MIWDEFREILVCLVCTSVGHAYMTCEHDMHASVGHMCIHWAYVHEV